MQGELLIQYLRDCATQNAMATYAKMTEITGHDTTQPRGRGMVYSAMKTVLNDYGYSFKVAPKQGYMPLQGVAKVTVVGKKSRNKIDGTVRKWRNHIDLVNPGDLDQKDLNTYVKENLRLQLAERITAKTSDHQIDNAMQKAEEDNPLSHANMKKMLRYCNQQLAGVG